MKTRPWLAGCILALASVLLAAAPAGAVRPAGAGGGPGHRNLHGTFTETVAGRTLWGYDIHGSAKLTVSATATVAKVNIAGLTRTKHYASHLHNGTCATGGGGHYQNVEGGATTPPNELWLTTSSNPVGGLDPNLGGVVHASGSATWQARLTSATVTNARSIVVHELPSGDRIACADLS